MLGEFSNKIAVVTGGSRGIGREIALGLSRSGAQTVIVSSWRKISPVLLRPSLR